MFDFINYYEKLMEIDSKQIFDVCLLSKNMSDKPYIATNGDNSYNKDYVISENFTRVKAEHVGGTIILFPNDIAFTWISHQTKLKDILNDIIIYLNKFDNNIVLKDNDVMLGDKKLFGTMSSGVGPYYEGMFFSFNSDIEIIKKVSTKPMVKEPIGLSAIGITSEDIQNLIMNLIQKYNLKLYE